MSYTSFANEHEKLKIKKLIFQRWFYAIVGILTMIPIVLLTLGQIGHMKKENNEFAFCLLLLVHSGCVLFSMISTALFCRITDALLTTLTIILLSGYTGIHFYIRFLFGQHHPVEDFTVITLRLGFVLIMLILLLPWASIMTHSYRMNIKREMFCPRATTFSWFLNLDLMLIISLLILNIRSQADFSRNQCLILLIGIPLALLWLIIGKLLANNKSRHWIVWTIFYTLSLIQIFHLVYITYWSIYEYGLISKTNEASLFPLLIITFICGGTSVLIHLLTTLISFSFFCI